MTTPISNQDGSASTRQHTLTQSAAQLRNSWSTRFSLERLFLIVGVLCLPVGVVIILLGWYGAAHTGHVYEQNDYLISGGILGLGLIFIGGFLYFGYWIIRQTRLTESGTQETVHILQRIERKLNATGNRELSPDGTFVVTKHGRMLHAASCPTVIGQSVTVLQHADTPTYSPCGICLPELATAAAE